MERPLQCTCGEWEGLGYLSGSLQSDPLLKKSLRTLHQGWIHKKWVPPPPAPPPPAKKKNKLQIMKFGEPKMGPKGLRKGAQDPPPDMLLILRHVCTKECFSSMQNAAPTAIPILITGSLAQIAGGAVFCPRWPLEANKSCCGFGAVVQIRMRRKKLWRRFGHSGY